MTKYIHLFNSFTISDHLGKRDGKMASEIDAIPRDRLLNTSVEDLADYFRKKYEIDMPRIVEGGITVADKEVKIPTQNYGRMVHANATEIECLIPFEGDGTLFEAQPSCFGPGPPVGSVERNEIVLGEHTTDHDAQRVKASIDHEIGSIRKYLEWLGNDVSGYNGSLLTKARRMIEARRNRILKDRGLVASLGYPVRQRPDAPKTFAVPVIRKKIVPVMPPAGKTPFVSEPALEMAVYEHILSVMSNMVTVMEQSPRAFRGMREEDLRVHFLVQLNGQYEGQATGETFNYEGKTDILIRAQGRNIFIAECKIWRGPKSVKEAMDQLLGYSTWRDTKTAIVVFNRGGDFTAVIGKTKETVKGHPNFKRELPYGSESGFRCVIRHRDDPAREMILTTILFDIPDPVSSGVVTGPTGSDKATNMARRG